MHTKLLQSFRMSEEDEKMVMKIANKTFDVSCLLEEKVALLLVVNILDICQFNGTTLIAVRANTDLKAHLKAKVDLCNELIGVDFVSKAVSLVGEIVDVSYKVSIEDSENAILFACCCQKFIEHLCVNPKNLVEASPSRLIRR